MQHRVLTSVFVLLTSLYGDALLAADTLESGPLDIDGITVFADSSTKDASGAAIRVDLGKLSLQQLGELNLSARHALIIVPEGLDPEVERKFTTAVANRIGAHRKAEIARVSVAKSQAAAQQAADEINFVKETVPGDEAAIDALAERMLNANAETLKAVETWAETFSAQVKAASEDPKKQSMLYGSLIGLTASLGPSVMWLSTTGYNFFGWAQVATVLMTDQINSTLSTRLIKWETEHQFPLFKDSVPVRLYNGSAYLRAVAVNLAMIGSTNFVLRTFSWWDDPQQIAAPLSGDFLASLGMLSVGGAFATAGSDVGVRTARKKGLISPRAELLINSVFNLTTQVNTFMLSSGMTEYFVYGVAFEWGAKIMASVLGAALPAIDGRVVVMHPAITDNTLNSLKYENGLEEAVPQERLLAKLQELNKDLELKAERRAWYLGKLRDIQSRYEVLKGAAARLFKQSCDGARFWLDRWSRVQVGEGAGRQV